MVDKFPIGTCTQMCPEEEIIFREEKGLVHIIEFQPGSTNKIDKNRMVKEFSRSAAGRETPTENNLRTIGAILNTLYFLFHDVVNEKKWEWNIIYDFILDRSRAIRQDMVIQNFPRPDFICVLQPMVRFYSYSAYRLCEEQVCVFDPVINKTHLQECLKRLLCLYDESDILVVKYDINKYEEAKRKILYFTERPFMEALYLTINLGHTEAMRRALKLPQIWKTPILYHCLHMSIEYWKGNYVRVCRLIKELPPLLLAYAALHLPTIRRCCLRAMSSAYHSKNRVAYPAGNLAELLLYEKTKDLLNDCRYYGLEASGNSIMFDKNTFNHQKPEIGPTRLKLVDEKLENIDLPDLLLYVKVDLETLA